MYGHDKKQYIFKLSSGKIINIFYKENSGIYISFLGRRNLWLEASPLIRDVSPGFSVDIDSGDNLYILYQDNHGSIMRGFFSNDSISTKSILSSKNISSYDKYLQVICTGDNIYYFYVLEYSGSKLLSYQVQKSNGNLSTPQVIDYVSDSPVPFTVLCDLHNELYVFYKSNDNKNPYIGYKKYDADKDHWSSFKVVSSYDSGSCVISAVTDADNSIHLAWQNNHPPKYEIMYKYKKQNSDKWEEEKNITSSHYPFYDSSLAIVNNILVFYWVKDNIINHSNTTIGSEFWSEPEKYPFEAKSIYCIEYKSNYAEELKNRHYTLLPGNFTAGYKLAFINDNDLKPGIPSINDVRELFNDTAKIFSKSLDEVNQRLKDLKNKIDDLEAKQLHTETELSKLGIKTSLINNEMSKLNTTNINPPQKNSHNSFWERQPTNVPLNVIRGNDALENNKLTESTSVGNEMNLEKNEYTPDIEDKSKLPVMPGTGFASITPEFLQSLSKK